MEAEKKPRFWAELNQRFKEWMLYHPVEVYIFLIAITVVNIAIAIICILQ